MLEHFWTIILSSGVASATTALVLFLGKTWIESRFEESKQRRLATFQSQLDSTAAAARFNYERLLQDYNLFVVRKHETYAELYARILDVQSQIVLLIRAYREIPQIEDLAARDAERYMVEHANIPAGMAANIVSMWDSDRKEALRRFEQRLDSMKPEYARRAWTKANNYRLERELYLSDAVGRRAAEITTELFRMFQEREKVRKDSPASLHANTYEITQHVHQLKTLMREELLMSSDAHPESSSGSTAVMSSTVTTGELQRGQ
jgi:hypothetical protein